MARIKLKDKKNIAAGHYLKIKTKQPKTMVASVGAVEFRQGVSAVLSRVEYGGERVAVTRHGKPVAVVVPLEDLEALEALEDALDLAEAKKAITEAKRKGSLSWEQVKKELGL